MKNQLLSLLIFFCLALAISFTFLQTFPNPCANTWVNLGLFNLPITFGLALLSRLFRLDASFFLKILFKKMDVDETPQPLGADFAIPAWACLLALTATTALYVASLEQKWFAPPENSPIIQAFRVTQMNSDLEQLIHPGQGIQLIDNTQLLIQPQIAGEYATPCQWEKNLGVLLPAGEGKCSVLYSQPITTGRDNLILTVQSQCGTLQTSASLFIMP